MKTKRMKIVISILLLAGVVASLNIGIRKKTNWKILQMANVEALTTPETENQNYNCVVSKGFCFIDGIKKSGISMME